MASSRLTVVVGAGISGLACAHALEAAGLEVLVLEAAPRAGGVIASREEEGYLLELGPQSFAATPALLCLAEELGLSGQLLEAPRGAPRYVLIDGVLTPVPMSPGAFLTSRLVGTRTKLALLTEVLRTSEPPEPDESVADFTRRKFSGELLDRLVGPFLSGVFAGDPERISFRAAFPKLHEAERRSGSVVRGLFTSRPEAQSGPRTRPRLVSFLAGNETLPRALAAKLGPRLVLEATVCGLEPRSGGFAAAVRSPFGTQEIACGSVVLAAPARAAAELLSGLAPEAAAALSEIDYAPVAVVSLGFPRGQVAHRLAGFGFLAPRSSGLRTLGTVWNSSLFPGRAPEEHVLLTAFVGGATDPGAVELPVDALTRLVAREIGPLLGLRGEPTMTRVTAYRRAIPQYTLGHRARLARVQQALAALPGLWVLGSYDVSPAIGSCVAEALAVAERVRIGYNT